MIVSVRAILPWSRIISGPTNEQDRSHNEVAMIVLGREIREIAKVNDQLIQRLIGILHEAIEGKSRLMEHMIADSEKESLAQKQKILRNVLKGMTEENRS